MTETNAEKSLVWRDLYEIGVDFIDDEHRQILAIMQCIGQAINDGDLGECAKQSDTLINAAKYHFRHEESYLEKVRFPRLIEHKKHHEELLKKVEKVKEVCEDTRKNHSLKECFIVLENILIDDVLRGDNDYRSFLEYNGYTLR